MGKFNTDTKKGKAQLFRAAAKAIEEHGWVKGKFGNCHSGFCAVGAIRFANGGKIPVGTYASPLSVIEKEKAQAVLGEEAVRKLGYITVDGREVVSLIAFNDRLASGPEDVTKLFRKIARHLEHGGSL